MSIGKVLWYRIDFGTGLFCYLCWLFLFFWVFQAEAQDDFTRQRFIQPRELPTKPFKDKRAKPELEAPQWENPYGNKPNDQNQPLINVKKIEVTGSTVFKPEDFKTITSQLEDKKVSFFYLKQVARKITEKYIRAGYLTSQAYLPPQPIKDGKIIIKVLEGNVPEIIVTGTEDLDQDYIQSRIALGAGKPLQVNLIEEQLRLLKLNPLIEDISASLQPAYKVGQTKLLANIKEANPFWLKLTSDNYSTPSVGSIRTGITLGHRNIFGFGDELNGQYQYSPDGGLNVGEANYRIPLNAMDGTLGLRAIISRADVKSTGFRSLGISADTNMYEISFRQPIIKSLREELALSLGFSHRDGQTFIGDIGFGFGIGPEKDGTTRTNVLRIGQDYLRRDEYGVWVLLSQFNIGVDILHTTTNSGTIPDGRFFSWLFQAQRVQRIDDENQLVAQALLQVTPDNLLPSEQFVVGGGNSVRGYRQNARFGDNGFRFSLEENSTIRLDDKGQSTLTIIPFFDMGLVWNDSTNPNNESLPGQRFLASVGLGLNLQPIKGLTLRTDYGYPIIKLRDRGNNLQDTGFHFSVILDPIYLAK